MALFKKKCIVCQKKIENKGIEKHEQIFCSKKCLEKFEKEMKKLKDLSLDNCC